MGLALGKGKTMFEYETYDRAAMKESSEEYQQAAKDQWMVDEAPGTIST